MISFLFLIVVLISSSFKAKVKEWINYEFNLFEFSNIFYGNIFNSTKTVSNEYIEVKNYSVENDCLFIEFNSNSVISPIDGVVQSVNKNSFTISDDEALYTFYLENYKVNIYENIKCNSVIGTGSSLIIESSAISLILERLIISYEEV